MQAEIWSVDYAPADLYPQVPFIAELLRELPGPNRPDYWLGRLLRPLRYAVGGRETEVRFVVLASRYVGESIRPGVGRIVVGVTYVLDEEQVTLPTVDMSKCRYVAIGEAVITEAAA